MNLTEIKIYKDYIDNGGEISIVLNYDGKIADAFIIENEELKDLKISLYRTLYGVIVDYLTREINLYGGLYGGLEERDFKDLKLLREKNHEIESIELLDKYLKVSINLMKGGE